MRDRRRRPRVCRGSWDEMSERHCVRARIRARGERSKQFQLRSLMKLFHRDSPRGISCKMSPRFVRLFLDSLSLPLSLSLSIVFPFSAQRRASRTRFINLSQIKLSECGLSVISRARRVIHCAIEMISPRRSLIYNYDATRYSR